MLPAAAAIPAAAEAVAAAAAPAAATAAGATAASSGAMAGLLKMLLGGGKLMAVSTLGALPFMFLPSLMGGPEGGSASPQDEEEMLQLMQALGGQAKRGAGTTRSDMLRTNAMVDMLDRREAMGSRMSTLGVADDLAEIIRGRQEMLGKIAHSEPISLAQAYAARGLFNPVVEQPMSFRGIM